MKLKKPIFTLLAFVLCSLSLVAGDFEIGQKWTLEKCLEYGLTNHPLIKMAENNIDSEQTQLDQTRAYWDPKLNFRAGFNRRKSDSGYSADPMIDSTSESLSVNKVLLDSGQNRFETKAVKNKIQAAIARQKNTRLEVVAGIKKAFFLAQQARELVKVREETLDGYLQHLEKVESFVEVGTRPPYDITRARVDVANSKVELIRGKSQFKITKANLARAVGFTGEIEIAELALEKLPGLDIQKERLKEEAFDRPELQAARKEIDSAAARIESARRALRPVVSASADYSWNGTTTPLNRQWTAGVSLNWSFFDGKLTRARIKSSEIQLDNAKESMKNLQLQVKAQLENAITGLEDALERFKATHILVQQASESMELANGRYDAGLGNPIEVTDARVEYARARGNHVAAYYDSLIALAELERILGRLQPQTEIIALDKKDLHTMEKNQ
jgi:outer membrane protein TolC